MAGRVLQQGWSHGSLLPSVDMGSKTLPALAMVETGHAGRAGGEDHLLERGRASSQLGRGAIVSGVNGPIRCLST